MRQARIRRGHPSGRPIAQHERPRELSIARLLTAEGPLTPRLRPGTQRVSAIGFHVDQRAEDDDGD
jgi:hypothetical protein